MVAAQGIAVSIALDVWCTRAYCAETGTVLVRAYSDPNAAQVDATESKLPSRARIGRKTPSLVFGGLVRRILAIFVLACICLESGIVWHVYEAKLRRMFALEHVLIKNQSVDEQAQLPLLIRIVDRLRKINAVADTNMGISPGQGGYDTSFLKRLQGKRWFIGRGNLVAYANNADMLSDGLSRVPHKQVYDPWFSYLWKTGNFSYGKPSPLILTHGILGSLYGFRRIVSHRSEVAFGVRNLILNRARACCEAFGGRGVSFRCCCNLSSSAGLNISGGYEFVGLSRSAYKNEYLNDSAKGHDAREERHSALSESMFLPARPRQFIGWIVVGFGSLLILCGEFCAFLFPSGPIRTIRWWWCGITLLITGCWIIHVGIRLALNL